LRQTVSSLGGVANGFPREDGFDIVPASEVMAVFCLVFFGFVYAFAGTGVYRLRVDLPPLPEGLVWRLVLPGVRETAELRLDGLFGGRHIAGDAWFTLPTQGVEVAIELHVRNTAANRYYSGTPYWDGIPKPSGLTAAPRLVSVAKEAHFGGGSPA